MDLPNESSPLPTKTSKKSRLNVLPAYSPSPTDSNNAVSNGRFPQWLHRKLPTGNAIWETTNVIKTAQIHTVCEEAKCPNLLECYSKKTATFLVLGKQCTRSCGFCSIDFSKKPAPPQENEPERIASSVKDLGLKHVVITMVARDDLEDGGAAHLVNIVHKVRSDCPQVTIELLTSDFQGNQTALEQVLSIRPEIFNHNLETVRALTPRVRHKATYDTSLQILRHAKKMYPQQIIKSGIMVGLGETTEDVFSTLSDLKQSGCDIVTIGQYLQSSSSKLLVKEFITPQTFRDYEQMGKQLGIAHVYSAPFVRSSYNAGLFVSRINGSIDSINSH